MAADEGLNMIIGAWVDAEGVLPGLEQVQSSVASTVDAVNAKLESLGGTDSFQKIANGADIAKMSIQELTASAEQATALLRILRDAESAAQSGTGVPLTRVVGMSAGDIEGTLSAIERQRAALTQINDLEAQIAARRAVAPPTTAVRGLSQVELEAQAAQLRAAMGAVTESRLYGPRGSRITGVQVGDERLSVDQLLARNQAVNEELRARQRVTEDSPYAPPSTPAEKKEVGAAVGATNAAVLDLERDLKAIGNAVHESAAMFEGQRLFVREPFRASGGVIDRGIYGLTGKTAGAPVSGLDYLRITSGNSSGAAFMGGGASGGGGGGFFGNMAYGFTHGFGGGGGGGVMGQAGYQLGMVAQYTLYYQAFREIEHAIKASVEQMLAFERATTDLQNVLGVTRDQARGLATDLARTGAGSGLAPSQSVALGAQFATTFQGKGDPAALAQQGVSLGGMIHVLVGGKDTSQDMRDVSGIVQAFNLDISDTTRVLDAATSAAQNFGLGNAGVLLPGLAQIGDLANQAGFSVEFMSNALADIQQRTGQTSASAAGELQRFLGREGNQAFQQVFTAQGINTTQPFQAELEQLSQRYDKLSQSEKAFIIGQFGGGRAGVDALAFLEDYSKIQDSTNKTIESGGISQQQYANRLNDVRGMITQLRGEFTLLAKDVGESGALAPIGLMLEMLNPVVKAADDIVSTFNKLPAPLRDSAMLIGEIALAARIIGGIGLGRALSTSAAGGRVAALGQSTGVAGFFAATTRNRTLGNPLPPGASFGSSVRMGIGMTGLGLRGMASEAGDALRQFINPLTLVIGGLVLFDETLHTVNGILRASTTAAGDTLTGGTAKDLQGEASTLRTDANKATQSSAGFFGTIYNALLGNPTGKGAANARSQADLAEWEAKQYTAALDATGSTRDLATALVDLGNAQDGVAASVKALQAAGYDAGQSIQALIDKLNMTNNVGENFLPVGQIGAAAHSGANDATNLFRQGIEIDKQLAASASHMPFGIPTPGSVGSGSPISLGQFKHFDYKSYNSDIAGTIQDYLSSLPTGEAGGVTLTPEMLHQEQMRVVATMKANLAKQGIDAKTIAKLLPDLTAEAGQAVRNQLQGIAGGIAALSSKQVIDLINNVQQLSGQAGQVATARFAQQGFGAVNADGTLNTSGAQVASQTAVGYLNQVRDGIEKNKQLSAQDKKNDLNYLAGLTAVVVQTGNEAALQNLQANNALLEASATPENTVDNIKQKLADISAILTDPKSKAQLSPDDIRTLKTTQAQLQASLAPAELQDAVSAIGLHTDPRNTEQTALDALNAAKATVKDYQTRKVTGATLNNAIKAQAQAQEAYNQAVVEGSIAQRDAGVRAGDPVAAATVALTDAKARLAADLFQQGRYWADLKAVHEAQAALATALAQRAHTVYELGHDITDPVAQALAQIQQARVQLNQDRARKTGDLQADELSLEQASLAGQKAAFDQQMSNQQIAYDLHRESAGQYLQFLESQDRALRAQLSGMRKGQQGYQQYVDELNAVDQAILSLNSGLQGQFNLGDIKVPTVYEVRRQLASSQQSVIDASTHTNNLTINGIDIAQVINYINSILGPSATGSRASSATRKVAA